MISTFTSDLYVHYFREMSAIFGMGAPITPEVHIEVMQR
jgi:hypothetical protein